MFQAHVYMVVRFHRMFVADHRFPGIGVPFKARPVAALDQDADAMPLLKAKAVDHRSIVIG